MARRQSGLSAQGTRAGKNARPIPENQIDVLADVPVESTGTCGGRFDSCRSRVGLFDQGHGRLPASQFDSSRIPITIRP